MLKPRYTLIIADDEETERKALNLYFTKSFPDVQVIDIVENGIELVSSIKRHSPDVAIVDINMPGMNGIEAIDMLRRQSTSTRFVINTAYDDFQYVQKALALKIDAYILKPEKRETTNHTIRNLFHQIDQMREERQAKDQLQHLYHRMDHIMESEIMFSLFAGEPAEESFQQYCNIREINFQWGTVVSLMPSESSVRQMATQDQKSLKQALNNAFDNSCVFLSQFSKGSVTLMILLPQRIDADHWCQWMNDVMSLALESLQLQCNLEFRAGIGSLQNSLLGLVDAYNESLTALQTLPLGSIRFRDALPVKNKELHSSSESAIHAKVQAVDNPHVEKALRLIHERYRDDLSLEHAADLLGISPFYLSRLFRRTLQKTFVACLTDIRMEHAQHWLLDSKFSISDIAKQTGYANQPYFSKVFKRHTGMTPGEYRSQYGTWPNKPF